MLKFLRKYQAWIMAVGGSLLMVAFLLPQVIQRFGSSMAMNKEMFIIKVDGRTQPISSKEWQEASSEMAILEAVFGTRDLGLVLGFPSVDSEDPQSPGLHGTDHWILLKRQAQLAGLIGGPADGDAEIQERAREAMGTTGETFDVLYDRLIRIIANEAAQSHMTLEEGKKAFATLAGISRLVRLYTGGAVASDNRMRIMADKFENKVNVAFVYLDASDRIADLPEPDEAALQEQFEKYRDVAPGEGEHGFGYRLPDRVKVEYLTIDYPSLLAKVAPSGLEARKWYERNKDKARTGADGQKPSFDEVADDAILAYRRDEAEKVMTEIGRFIKGQLLKASQALDHDGQYRVLAEDWAQRRVSFETLRDQIQERFGVTVEYHADTRDWTALSDLGSMEGIGSASRLAGMSNLSFAQLVNGHREIGETKLPGLQVGLADPDLLRRSDFSRGTVGPSSFPANAYLYRVIEYSPSHAPESLADVREQVVRDVKRIQAYEQLAADVDTWRQRALDEGLDDLAKSLGQTVRRGAVSLYGNAESTPGDFQPSDVGRVNSKTLVDAIYARATQVELLKKYTDLPMEERIIASPVPEELGLALVRLENHFPPTRQRWLKILEPTGQMGGLRISEDPSPVGSPVQQVMVYQNFDDLKLSPFSFTAMKERFNYVDKRNEKESDPAAPALGESDKSG